LFFFSGFAVISFQCWNSVISEPTTGRKLAGCKCVRKLRKFTFGRNPVNDNDLALGRHLAMDLRSLPRRHYFFIWSHYEQGYAGYGRVDTLLYSAKGQNR
jgi:hypothetical protein